MLSALGWLISIVTAIIFFVVLAQIVMTWLYQFNVLNSRNPNLQQLYRYLNSLVHPMTQPLRRFLPKLGGVDISPMVLLLIVGFVRQLGNAWLPH